MASKVPLPTESSPRSTVLASSDLMTTNVAAMNEGNSMASEISNEPKVVSVVKTHGGSQHHEGTLDDPAHSTDDDDSSPHDGKQIPNHPSEDRHSTTTSLKKVLGRGVHPSYGHMTGSVTPMPGYYMGYHPSHVTQEPPSPAGTLTYEAGSSFFQQPGAFVPHSNSFGAPSTPLSPPRVQVSVGTIPPASPLFPRVNNNGGLDSTPNHQRSAGHQHTSSSAAPHSPSISYMSSSLIPPSNLYTGYAPSGVAPDTPGSNWAENRNQTQNVYQSPQIGQMPYGMTMSRAGRAYSFEESMLPPAVLDPQDSVNPQFSPYGGSQSSGATMLQQPWTSAAYGGPLDVIYSTPGSPLQPRPSAQAAIPMFAPAGPLSSNVAGGMRAMGGNYGTYYQASSPGPPIQTTPSNKGPDGANLFIFHIPNHFTNADMYHLFCPYGNLLSVRIMVEKETGRSRGFGFVSYDSPESAAQAIKELNGFAIGNKRLKVQHKQIRPKDMMVNDRDLQDGYNDGPPTPTGSYHHTVTQFPQLPPAGPSPPKGMWYDKGIAATEESDEVEEQESEVIDVVGPLDNLSSLQSALPVVPGTGAADESAPNDE